MASESEQRLGTDFDGGAGGRRIIDRVTAARWALEFDGGERVQFSKFRIADQLLERRRQRRSVDIAEPPLAGKQGSKPLLGARGQRFVVQRWHRRIDAVRKDTALAEAARVLVPRKPVEAMFAHSIEQRLRNGFWIGRGSGTG